jgi:phosphate transport system substrate-binding protein
MKIKVPILFFVLILIGIYRCNGGDSHTDTPTSGNLAIAADETYKPLIESEVLTFESIYKYANITVKFKPEAEVFNDLMNDSVRLIIVSRKLNDAELKQFEKWEIVPKVTKIAYDAIALIGSKDLKDTVYTLDQLNMLLSAGVTDKKLKNIKVVFDNNNSSTIRFIKEKTGVKEFSSNCYALNSGPAVLDYVSKEKNTIGIIGVDYISEQDDTTSQNFIKTIKVLDIAVNSDSEAFKPYQAYIAQKIYPLYREVYIVSKEAYTGLGTGFTAFVASERGQRIVLKLGLVPATMPVRLVEVVKDDIFN